MQRPAPKRSTISSTRSRSTASFAASANQPGTAAPSIESLQLTWGSAASFVIPARQLASFARSSAPPSAASFLGFPMWPMTTGTSAWRLKSAAAASICAGQHCRSNESPCAARRL
eukprot:scaffold79954_cov54-Phaeocystis_antarctica.AAC.3